MQNGSVRMIGMIALIGGICFANYGLATARAAHPEKGDPNAGGTQSWDKNLPSSSRFMVLSSFGGAAVRDNNTDLVWEKTPSSASQTQTWEQASLYCLNLTVGGAAGWRLPSVVELKSIQDPTLPQPFVPTTVFTGLQLSPYWSATTNANSPSLAWYVDFGSGNVTYTSKANGPLVWCVRGPMNADAY